MCLPYPPFARSSLSNRHPYTSERHATSCEADLSSMVAFIECSQLNLFILVTGFRSIGRSCQEDHRVAAHTAEETVEGVCGVIVCS